MADIKTPLTTADIVSSDATKATMRYDTGFNNSGTGRHEVLQYIRRPDDTEGMYVIMRGLTAAKTAAIVMILNAPEA